MVTPSRSSSSSAVGSRLHAAIPAHSGPCNVVRYNTLGRYILTGGSDRQIHLYNATYPSTVASPSVPIKSYTAHSHEVLALCISSDNNQFASGGGDKNVYVWDVASGTILRRFNAHVGKINAVEFGGVPSNAAGGGDSVLSAAGFDGVVRFYDLRSQGSWRPLMELKQSRDAILSLAVTASRVYTGSVDGHLRTYDIRAGRLSSDLLDAPIASVRPSKTESSILVSSLDAKVRLFDTENGECLQTLDGHAHKQYRCRATLTCEEDAVVMGDEEGRLHVWDLVSGRRREVTSKASDAAGDRAHAKAVLWTEVNPVATNGNEVVTAGADGVVAVWAGSQPGDGP